MSDARPASAIKLKRGETGDLVDAMIFEGLTDKNISDHEILWVPQLQSANELARERGGDSARRTG